ncbi:MlaA family lipoprotein [Pelistega europaea]|uniref:VacJ family lipoprotein n=1 Tax=Pelistega europaea TaxID=106147 RepID=A0A7Y4P5B5_9BURK|nr:VacJ family lipoprotein [Pelistega europaea]NOL50341.1 VacJ family lipoprotein [Pelistega europaea]
MKKIFSIAVVGVLLSACTTVKNPSPEDPLESYNRAMFNFNEKVDKAVLRPVAKGYEAVVPQPVRSCVHNIFGNLGDVWSGINSMLQGRGLDFVNTMGRVLFNSTVGLGGCFDVASKTGAKKIPNDFGITLGVWGLSDGAYVVLPILGASSVRDSIGLLGDGAGTLYTSTTPWAIDNVPLRNSLVAVQAVDKRAALLNADDIASDVSIDKYAFIRDAYKQNRMALLRSKFEDEITDGTPDTAYLYEDTTESGIVIPGQERRTAYRKKLRERRLEKLKSFDKFSVPEYEDPGE